MCVGKSKYDNHLGCHSLEFGGEIYMYYKIGTVVQCMRLKTNKKANMVWKVNKKKFGDLLQI